MANLQDLMNNFTSPYNQGSPMKNVPAVNAPTWQQPNQLPQQIPDWQKSLQSAVQMIDKLRKPSLWGQVPAGTPTLGKHTLDENIRASQANEQLQAQQLAETLRHNKVSEGLTAASISASRAGSAIPKTLTPAQRAGLYHDAAQAVRNNPNLVGASEEEINIATDNLFKDMVNAAEGSSFDPNLYYKDGPQTGGSTVPVAGSTATADVSTSRGFWDVLGSLLQGKANTGIPDAGLDFNGGSTDENAKYLLNSWYKKDTGNTPLGNGLDWNK